MFAALVVPTGGGRASSVISVAPPGVAAKRGGDPTVDGSHCREEGDGVKDNDDDKYHEGGGGGRSARQWQV